MNPIRRELVEKTVKDLHDMRAKINFPEYQRERNLWGIEKNALLIDSIMENIDIPKLYFAPSESPDCDYEVVDGQQRLWAIWGFYDDDFAWNGKKYTGLTKDAKYKIDTYKLQITLIHDASDEYLRTLFLRLQLGLLLVTGEKLHAMTGEMRDFIFKRMAAHSFIRKNTPIQRRRFAHETLCAQICINSFFHAKLNMFARTRFEDLQDFFLFYASPTGEEKKIFDQQTENIMNVLSTMYSVYKHNIPRNRSLVLSVYLLFEDMIKNGKNDFHDFVEFMGGLIKELKNEANKGMHRTNSNIYKLQSYLSNAPGEKYQIKFRHELIKKLFDYYLMHKKIAREPLVLDMESG